ncbi:MAG: hypothetical protein R3Y05_00680 [bacterium]
MDIKVENNVFKGVLEIPSMYKKIKRITFDVKGTDEELTNMLVELQTKLKENKKYLIDMMFYSSIKYVARCGLQRHLTIGDDLVSKEGLDKLEEYAKSVNLLSGYKGYEGDVRKFVEDNFKSCDIGLVTYDFEVVEFILHSKGGFAITPAPLGSGYNDDEEEAEYDEYDCQEFWNQISQEVWCGDYIEFNADLVGGVEFH